MLSISDILSENHPLFEKICLIHQGDLGDKRSHYSALMTTIYAGLTENELMIHALFAIPQLLESLPAPDRVSCIEGLTWALIDGLAWAQTITLPVSLDQIDFSVLSTHLKQYFSHYRQIQSNQLCHDYRMTLFATCMLELMSEHLRLIDRSDDQSALVISLTQAKKICHHILKDEEIIAFKNYPSIAEIVNFFSEAMLSYAARSRIPQAPKNVHYVEPRETSSEFEEIPICEQDDVLPLQCIPEIGWAALDKIHKSFICIMECHSFMRSCLEINELKNAIDQADCFEDIQKLVLSLMMSGNQSLIHISRYHEYLLLDMIRLVSTNDLNELKSRSRTELLLLARGLADYTSEAPMSELFNFIFLLYNEDSLLYRPFLLSLLLKEGYQFDPSLIENHTILSDLIAEEHDVDMALALSIGVSPLPKTTDKRALYEKLSAKLSEFCQKSTSHQLKIYSFWKLLQFKIVPKVVEEQYNNIFEWHLFHIAINNREQFFELCSLISVLMEKYRVLIAGNQSQVSKAESREHLEQLEFYSDQLRYAIMNADEFDFKVLLTILNTVDETAIPILLQLLTNSGALSSFFSRTLLEDKKNSYIQKIKHEYPEKKILLSIYYDHNYFAQLSTTLERMKSKVVSIFTIPEKDHWNTVSLFLVLMVLVWRPSSKKFINQDAWKNVLFNLMDHFMTKARETVFVRVLSTVIMDCDLYTLLSSHDQRLLMRALGGGEWLTDDRLFEELLASLSEEDNTTTTITQKNSKKSKKSKKSVQSVDDPATQSLDTPHELIIGQTHPAATLVNSDTNPLSVEWKKLDKYSFSKISTSSLLMTVDFESEENYLEEKIDPQQHLLEQYFKSTQKHRMKLLKVIAELRASPLPFAFSTCIDQVYIQINELHVQLLALTKITPIPDNSLSIVMPIEDLYQQEEKWNETLATYSCNMQHDIEKYLPDSCFAPIQQTVSQALESVSVCYFKNPALHIATHIMALLNEINQFFMDKEFKIVIMGSYFVDKEHSGDLDLLLIPRQDQRPEAMIGFLQELTKNMTSCAEATICGVFRAGDIFQQSLFIRFIDHPALEMDLNFSLQPLSTKQHLDMMLRSFISPGAVHWSLKGSAQMPANVALANTKQVLKLLGQPDYDGLVRLSGYFLKNIIKYHDWRLDPHLKAFVEHYINPVTRYAAIKEADPRFIVENKEIICSALSYLFNRFQRRMSENIHYILKQNLLQIVFSLSPDTNALCTSYFDRHFNPGERDNFPKHLSSETFLVMFLLGAIIDRDPKQQIETMTLLSQQIQGIEHVSFKRALSILAKLPKTTLDMYVLTSKYKSSTHPSSSIGETRSIGLLLTLWHPENSVANGAVFQSKKNRYRLFQSDSTRESHTSQTCCAVPNK